MRPVEYLLSMLLALMLLAGAAVWTQMAHSTEETALSCRPGRTAKPVFLKGMSIYPRCPGGKPG